VAAVLQPASIRTEEDVVTVRRLARDIAAELGFDRNDQTRIATAVSEIARNAFRYAGGGAAEFRFLQDGSPELQIEVSDSGPGIRDLHRILNGTYKSQTGMGMGIVGARRLMDGFSLESEPGKGTRVTLTRSLNAGAARVPAAVPRIAKIPAAQPREILEELRHENQELMRVLEELRNRQQELAQLNAELEDTNRGVVALYAELDERAERLRHADQMKSRFLSHMSHEFRTPLTSILALSRLLLDQTDGQLTPEQSKQVGFIRRSAESLLEMVNDLLDLARVEAGKIVVRPTEFQVSNLFGALRSVLRPLRVNESVELVFEDAAGIPAMHTDESKVAQILRNFVSNALKFTESGEVRVTARISEDGDRVVFSVADTGIGISPENLDLIFQEFAQVQTPLQARFRGTGLGLPLSKGLAEVLGGSVRVESRPGSGSSFFAEIPVVFGAEPRRQGGPASAVDFLLIDDEEVSRYLLRQSLGAAAIAEASDGASGIEAARQLRPGAVLLDLRMPGMGGVEVLRALAADTATKSIPVIIMTAKALTSDERSELNEHATAVLSKELLSQPDAGARIRAVLAGR
jgi:signal transduction histidine kinase/CheY-like chemotaxis protein